MRFLHVFLSSGENGIAYTLVTDNELDLRMAPFLIRNLRDARQPISHALVRFAEGHMPSSNKPYESSASPISGANTSFPRSSTSRIDFTSQPQQSREASEEDILRIVPDEPRGGRTMNPKRKRYGKINLDPTFMREGISSAKKSFRNSFIAAKGKGSSGDLFVGQLTDRSSASSSPPTPTLTQLVPKPASKRRRKSRWGPQVD